MDPDATCSRSSFQLHELSESMTDSQQLQQTDVSIPLPAGYECNVQLDRCSVRI